MKRANGVVDGGDQNLGFKKVKFLNGVDESLVGLERDKAEGVKGFIENGGMCSAEVYNNGGPSAEGNHDVPSFGGLDESNRGLSAEGIHDVPSFGGLDESNRWDFDVSYDTIFGIEEEQRGLVFDLNLPVYRAPDGGLDVINEKKVEIIDIASDDSEDEVEITGYSYGYNANVRHAGVGVQYDGILMDNANVGHGVGVQYDGNMMDNANVEHAGVGVQYDGNMMDNLSLGLGVLRVDHAIGESSSLVSGGAGRYTWEEKGKANVLEADLIDDDLFNSWLSLKANSPINLDFQTDSDESIGIDDHIEDIEVGMWQPEVLHVNDLAERELQRAEEAFRNRERLTRETRRNTARRFARINFAEQDSGDQSSSKKQKQPTSSPLEQLGISPGPFSDALKKVRERTSKRTADQLIEWRPLEGNQNWSLSEVFVPSLLDLSLKALAENAEGIVSLDQVPDNLRGRLSNILCDISKMNGHIMKILVEGCPTDIRIKNCSWLTEEQFQLSFGNCQTKDLRVLQLDLCGQCMLDCAFRTMFSQSSNAFARLAILSLRGACRFSDSGLKDLVRSAPALRSINLGQCALLTSDSINFIADSLGSNLRELYIDECLKIEAMLILPAFKKFRYLEVLSVAGLLTVTDIFVGEILKVCGGSIRELDLANCSQLTDCSLKTIGSSCADLCSLNISNLDNLTDMGLEYLANGCKSLQKLKLRRNDFSDEAVAAFLESSGESLTELLLNNMTKVGPNTAFSLAKSSRKLLSLDISSCRKISNEALGLIVDSCSSLKLLKVFGCRQITNVFLDGHSNRLVRIIGLKLGPILDHIDLLEPEEVLLKYSPLPDQENKQDVSSVYC